MVIYRAES